MELITLNSQSSVKWGYEPMEDRKFKALLLESTGIKSGSGCAAINPLLPLLRASSSHPKVLPLTTSKASSTSNTSLHSQGSHADSQWVTRH